MDYNTHIELLVPLINGFKLLTFIPCYIFTGVNCSIELIHDSEQCLSQQVDYQCTVTDSTNLIWRVINDNGTLQVGYNSFGVAVGQNINNQFFFEQSSEMPSIISNVTFTALTDINGYTVQCGDGQTSRNFTVQILGELMHGIVGNSCSFVTV